MSRWLADYEVEAHLCIPDASKLTYLHPKGLFEIQLKNLRTAPGTDTPLLSAHVIFDADNAELAAAESKDLLKLFLDTLALVTNTRFGIHQLVRVVDWTPGLAERQCLQFKGFAGAHLPIPCLGSAFIDTVRALHETDISPRLRRALKWFAQGVGSVDFDDQFQCFWFVLELVAELKKDRSPVPDLCPKCRSALYCPACGTTPTHRPFPKQAIQQLVERLVPDNGLHVFSKFVAVRNQMLHAEEIRDVETALSVSISDVVDEVGRVAWRALRYAFQGAIDGKRDFLEVSSYTHRMLNAVVDMRFGAAADPQNPRVEDLPTVEVSLITTEKPREDRANGTA